MRRLLPFLAAVLAVSCGSEHLVAPQDQVADDVSADFHLFGGAGDFTIMTQNMYFGAPVENIIGAPTDQVPIEVAKSWATLMATDFPARARALAAQIARVRPDVIGLQEVAQFYSQTPSDILQFVPDGQGGGQVTQIGYPIPNATHVELDFLPTLLVDLRHRGLHYRVASIIKDTDIEMPRYDGLAPEGYPLFSDIRLVDYDVVLVRDGIPYRNAAAGNYTAALEINPLQSIKRGWAAVDVKMRGNTYRFVSTHLESDNNATKLAQAQELVQVFQSEQERLIIVGDFNSGPGRPDAGGLETYDFMLSSGYADLWLQHPGGQGDGFTCCNAGDLSNTTPDGYLIERIDLMFLRNFPDPSRRFGHDRVRAWLVGETVGDLRRYGVWASDHAGVAADFDFVGRPHWGWGWGWGR
jgi:endonuclease/exonuclease/phosphatase family metal-dependent hydrolase